MYSNNNMLKLKDLLSKDTSKYKPKILLTKQGKPTTKFLNWNKKQVEQGKTTFYIGNQFYNLDNKKWTDKPLDKRNRAVGALKPSFTKDKALLDSVFTNKDKNLKSYTFTDTDEKTSFNEDLKLSNNLLLQKLIQKHNISGNYRIIIKVGNIQILDGNYNIDEEFLKLPTFRKSSEYMIWNNPDIVNKGDRVTFIFTKETKLPYKYYGQRFLDGLNHCFFHPILQYYKEQMDNVKSKKAKERYQSWINKIEGKVLKTGQKKTGFLDLYKDGIPEEKISGICEELQIGVDIEQPFNKKLLYEYRSNQRPRKIFKFVNTRLNHIEVNETPLKVDGLFNIDNVEYIESLEDMKAIKKDLITNKELCIYSKNNFGISGIRTLNKSYKLTSDFNTISTEWENEYNLKECRIDALKYPELQSFIDNGTHYNETIDFKDTSEFYEKENIPKNIKHIDIVKAYTQFKQSKYYNGFLGKITDFRKVDNYKEKGLYYIEELDLKNTSEKFQKLNRIMGWFINKNIYTDSELTALKLQNGKFKVISGCFGVKIDFEFNEQMTNNKVVVDFTEDKKIEIPYYSKWTGLSLKKNYTKNFYMEGNQEFFNTINKDNDFNIWYENQEARISYDSKYVYNNKHIASQIIAYQRLNILDQVLKMDYNKIIRICVDGIYYEDHKFKMDKIFNKKEKMTFKNHPSEHYLTSIYKDDKFEYIKQPEAEPREYYKSELWKGAGGNGKTYHQLFIDKGLINPVYIAHSWKLASYMKSKYEKTFNKTLSVSVHYRLFNYPFNVELSKKYNNYIIDECSTLNNNEKETILKEVKGKVILCGDIGYQLPPIHGEEMNEKNINKVIELTKNYRFKDSKIKKRIDFVRENINKNINFRNLGIQEIDKEELKKIYNKEDIILVSENTFNDEYIKLLDSVKYRVLENTRDYKNGEIVFEDVTTRKELRHGYTIHSVQGETYEKKIFIDIRKQKSNRMFYTAISRAQNFNQLYLII